MKKKKNQMVPCKSTAKDASFEWSHHRISSTDSKVKTTLHVSIIHSGSERVNLGATQERITFSIEHFTLQNLPFDFPPV